MCTALCCVQHRVYTRKTKTRTLIDSATLSSRAHCTVECCEVDIAETKTRTLVFSSGVHGERQLHGD